jgi:AraC-like DNA-binding protein
MANGEGRRDHVVGETKRFAEIASAVGYDSESSFGKAFRRVMGVSAGQYRREKRLEPSSTS